jgi:hypothetical protein
MKKFLEHNKKIIIVFALIVVISSIYFFFYSDKKQYYVCSGKDFNKTGEINDIWIFDIKNKFAYQNTMTAIPLFLEIYPDMYVFNKTKSDGSINIKFRFFKLSETLHMEGTAKSTSTTFIAKLNCRKRS